DVISGNNAIVWRRFDTLNPRFINLNASTIYNTFGDINSAEIAPLAQPWALPSDQSDPRGVLHRDITLLDISSSTDPSRFGNDYIAGGAGDDEIFGELGNDIVQGDGSVALNPDGTIANLVGATRLADGTLVVSPSVENPSATPSVLDPTHDGNDYIEG